MSEVLEQPPTEKTPQRFTTQLEALQLYHATLEVLRATEAKMSDLKQRHQAALAEKDIVCKRQLANLRRVCEERLAERDLECKSLQGVLEQLKALYDRESDSRLQRAKRRRAFWLQVRRTLRFWR